MIAHGLRHGRTLDGTAGWFGSIGFRRPRFQALVSAVVETGADGALGSGRLSIDHLVGRRERLSGGQRAGLTTGLGLAAAAAQLALFWRRPVPATPDGHPETLPPEPATAPAGPDEAQ